MPLAPKMGARYYRRYAYFVPQHPTRLLGISSRYRRSTENLVLRSISDWQSPADVKTAHRNASIIANNRVVFNIKGNSYRLIVAIRYDLGIIFIRFIGTHAEYDKVDAEVV